MVGRRAPWDPNFAARPPRVGAELIVGPPDFVGVGVQKAGTTWWFSLLEQHPGIYSHPGLHKERHYFARFAQTQFTAGDAEEYRRWFPRPPGRLTGEWTPDYLAWPWAPPLLRQAAPDARVLVLLRDPVDRYASGLGHERAVGNRVTPEAAANAFWRGMYGAQLQWLYRWFPQSQVLVLQYELCREATSRELSRTFEFLGVDPGFVPADATARVNESRERVLLSKDQRRALALAYAEDLRSFAAVHPHIDVDRWPTFGEGQPG
jgi:hypothetical protein